MSYKRLLILLYAAFSMLVTLISVFISSTYFDKNYSLGLGISFMILAIPFHFLGRKFSFFYIFSIMLTSIGVGFSIMTYYHFKTFSLSFLDYSIAYITTLTILSLFGYLSHHRLLIKHTKLWLILTIVLCFIISLTLWLTIDSFSGLTFYLLNISYFYMIAMIASNKNLKDLSAEISRVMFGAFILVTLIVLIIVTEGDFGDAGDAFSVAFDFPEKKRRIKK